jgi:hypothetical protein
MLTRLDSLDPIEKPERIPLSIEAVIVLLSPFMKITNKKGDKGSPYLTL